MMKITIHRGQNQIGGNIVEISTSDTSILFDAGCELDDGDDPKWPPIATLFDSLGRDGIFISHYHRDHFGLVENERTTVPVFMGAKAYAIAQASATYKERELSFNYRPIEAGRKTIVGGIAVTPFLADHSAYDSYMLLAETNGQKLLYTGDFRSHGRKSFPSLLNALPGQIDALICEGTTLSRERYENRSERELEATLDKALNGLRGPLFILQSTANIDRMVTAYRSAKKSGRLFLQDLYMAEIASALGSSIPNPRFQDVRVFITRGYEHEHSRYKIFSRYGDKRIGVREISREKFVMCVRSSMCGYLKHLSEMMDFSGGLLVYSMWRGYQDRPDVQKFLETSKDLGLGILNLHTSGHADSRVIETLVDHTNPRVIMPIHTENAAWFENRFDGVEVCQGGSLCLEPQVDEFESS